MVPKNICVPDHINHGPVLCNLAAPILRWTCNSSILGPPGIIQNNLNVRSRKHPWCRKRNNVNPSLVRIYRSGLAWMTNYLKKKQTPLIYHHKPLGLLKLYHSPTGILFGPLGSPHEKNQNFISSFTSPGANEVTNGWSFLGSSNPDRGQCWWYETTWQVAYYFLIWYDMILWYDIISWWQVMIWYYFLIIQ